MPSLQDKKIQFHFLHNGNSLRNRITLKRFLVWLFKKERKNLDSVNYIFCSDSYLHKINKKYLGHNYFTDIITFPLSIPGDPITAEIYISIDRVRDNASNYKTSIKKELLRVIFHGALHLCGYKDKTKAQSIEIREKEDEYLTYYFDNTVSRGTIR